MRANSALNAADSVFHDAYDEARAKAELEAPLLVVLADELALHWQGQRRSIRFDSPHFHTAKAVAHVAVALFTLTQRPENAAFSRKNAVRLASIREHVAGTLDALRRDPSALEPQLGAELVPVLESALLFAEGALAEQGASEAARAQFARANGPRILRMTEVATCGQIAALHEAVGAALAVLSTAERRTLQVVVMGDHQARARSMGMQYFQRRFGEAEGADERVTYGENVSTEKEALALVGTRRLDRAIARAFFDDEKRLQRDVLADAAKVCLDRLQPSRIE